MTGETPTVFIVDDDEVSRRLVLGLVRSIGIPVKTFSSAEDFLAGFDRESAGCLVTDVRMMGMSGMELHERLVSEGVKLPVIIMTAHAETPLTVKAVKLGAVTVLEKPCRDYELYDAIRVALKLDAQIRSETARHREFLKKIESLSTQERQVLEFMLEGLANKAIARRLDVSVRTVENRRKQIFEKSGAQSLAELIRLFVESKSTIEPTDNSEHDSK